MSEARHTPLIARASVDDARPRGGSYEGPFSDYHGATSIGMAITTDEPMMRGRPPVLSRPPGLLVPVDDALRHSRESSLSRYSPSLHVPGDTDSFYERETRPLDPFADPAQAPIPISQPIAPRQMAASPPPGLTTALSPPPLRPRSSMRKPPPPPPPPAWREQQLMTPPASQTSNDHSQDLSEPPPPSPTPTQETARGMEAVIGDASAADMERTSSDNSGMGSLSKKYSNRTLLAVSTASTPYFRFTNICGMQIKPRAARTPGNAIAEDGPPASPTWI